MIKVTVNIDMTQLKEAMKPISEADIERALAEIGKQRQAESALEMRRLSWLYHEKQSFLSPKYSTPYIRNRMR